MNPAERAGASVIDVARLVVVAFRMRDQAGLTEALRRLTAAVTDLEIQENAAAGVLDLAET